MDHREVLGRYEVLETLSGRLGAVTLKVADPQLQEALHARQLVAHLQAEGTLLARLERDVAVAMRVGAPGLVPYRRCEASPGKLLILRPWVRAQSLSNHPRFALGGDPRARGALASAEELGHLARGALDAIRSLHDCGVLARRLRPENLFVDAHGRVLLADWGIRVPSLEDGDPCPSQLSYVAPEVIAGLPPDTRSDLYSLGVVLYQLATGGLPRMGMDGLKSEPGGLDRLHLPLRGLVTQLLERDGSRRPPSAAQALHQLGSASPGRRRRVLDFRSTPLVGREGELEDLRVAVGQVAAGRGGLVFLCGERGSGRTRLLDEAARIAASRGLSVLQGGPEEPSGNVFGRFKPCFDHIARAMSSWPSDDVREVLQSDGRVLLEITSAFHERDEMRRLPEPLILGTEASRRRLLRVAARVVAAYAKRSPLVLVLDDLSTADPLSVDFTRVLARQIIEGTSSSSGVPILVIAAYENGDDRARGGLRATAVAMRAKGHARELSARPLAPHEVRDLLVERIQSDALPNGFVARVMTETAGNPLQIQELLSWLGDAGVLDGGPDEWLQLWEKAATGQRREELVSPVVIDDSLSLILGGSGFHTRPAQPTAEVRAGLGHLSPDAVRLLETSALAGPEVSLDVLEMATGLSQAAFTNGLIEALSVGAVIESAPGRLSCQQKRVAAFAVSGLGVAEERLVHGRLGLALEQHVGSLDERTPLLLAHHFHLAGDVERSLLYLPLAARIFKDRHVPNEALRLFRRFFRHLQVLEPAERERHLGRRLQGLQSMAETLIELDRRPEAAKVLREMAALAEGHGREADQVTAWSGLARLSLEAGEAAVARDFAQRAVDLARSRELATAVADNMCVLGILANQARNWQQAIWLLTGALKVHDEQGDVLGVGRALEAIGEVHESRYQHQPALRAFRKAYRQYLSIDDKVGVSRVLNWLGRLHLTTGDAVRALAHHREALRLEREAFDREGMGATLDLLGEAYRLHGDLEHADEAFKEALSLKRELADVGGSADSLLFLAHVRHQAGAIQEALSLLDQALTLARRTGCARTEAGCLVALARAHAELGETQRALELAEDGLGRARLNGERSLECRAQLILAGTGDSDRALEAAEAAMTLANAIGNRRLLVRAQLRQGEIYLSRAEHGPAVRAYREALRTANAVALSSKGADHFFRDPAIVARLRDATEMVGGEPGECSRTDTSYPLLQQTIGVPLQGAALS